MYTDAVDVISVHITRVLVCVVCSVGICWWKRIRLTVRSRY